MNQDRLEWDVALGLFVVADGMGGHNAGEVASQLAVETIRQFIAESAAGSDTWPFPYETGHSVDANRLLGLPDDAREYHAAAEMLAHFDVKSVLVMTNNPAKVEALRSLGVTVEGRLPVVIAPTPFSASYLETKRARMAHELPPRLLNLRSAAGSRHPEGELKDGVAQGEAE